MGLQFLWKNFLMKAVPVAVVLLCLAACSEKEEKETVISYQPSFQEVDLVLEEAVGSCCIDNGRFFASYSEYTEEDICQSYLLSCGLDGSDVKKTELPGSVEAMAVDAQGKMRIIAYQNQKYRLDTLDDGGNMIDSVELLLKKQDFDSEGDFAPTDNTAVFLDKTLYIGSGNKIFTFDETGKAGETYEYQEYYIEALFAADSGKVYIYAGKGKETGFCEFDTQTGKLGEFSAVGNYRIFMKSMIPGKENRVYISDGRRIYSYDLSAGKIEEEINWLNSGVDIKNMIGCFLLEDGSFLAVDCPYEKKQGYHLEFIAMKKKKQKETAEVVTLAVSAMNDRLKQEIFSFNKENRDIQIEVRDYSNYEDPGKQMNLDFTAGKIPDIINVTYNISYDSLVKKGMFTDLYPLMEQDPEIKKEDFLPSVLKAVEKDGKLYNLPVQFSLRFLVTSKRIAGNRKGWTAEEMLEAYQGMKKGSYFMEYPTRENYIHTILQNTGDYVHWDTGEVLFDSEDFIRLIEYSQNFESEDAYNNENAEALPVLVKKDKLFVTEASLYEITGIQLYSKMYGKKGGFAVMGYPSKNRDDSVFMVLNDLSLSITEQCKDKAAAWQFVRRFFTYDFQKNAGGPVFPARKDAFEKCLEYAAAAEEYTDEDGMKIKPYKTTVGWNLSLGPITEKEADRVRGIVERIGSCLHYGREEEEMQAIIEEELEAFYAGDKSAKETAEMIQDRVEIYVSENS